MGQLQHLSENYFRVKHYLGSVDGKLKFQYHKQSPQYVQSLVSKPSPTQIDPIDPKTIDPNLRDNSSFSGNMAGGVGFALPTSHGFRKISSAPMFFLGMIQRAGEDHSLFIRLCFIL